MVIDIYQYKIDLTIKKKIKTIFPYYNFNNINLRLLHKLSMKHITKLNTKSVYQYMKKSYKK